MTWAFFLGIPIRDRPIQFHLIQEARGVTFGVTLHLSAWTSKSYSMARDLIPSVRTICSIKPGDERRRLSDGEGLYLLLFVKGAAHGWRFDYSIGGSRKLLSLGTYPDTGLAAARKKADDFRQLVAQGVDPSQLRKLARAGERTVREQTRRAEAGLPASGSFEAIARDWLSTIHTAKVSVGHAERTRIRLEQDVFPWLGQRPIDEIRAPELLHSCAPYEANQGGQGRWASSYRSAVDPGGRRLA
jgi:hypothetical protein